MHVLDDDFTIFPSPLWLFSRFPSSRWILPSLHLQQIRLRSGRPSKTLVTNRLKQGEPRVIHPPSPKQLLGFRGVECLLECASEHRFAKTTRFPVETGSIFGVIWVVESVMTFQARRKWQLFPDSLKLEFHEIRYQIYHFSSMFTSVNEKSQRDCHEIRYTISVRRSPRWTKSHSVIVTESLYWRRTYLLYSIMAQWIRGQWISLSSF